MRPGGVVAFVTSRYTMDAKDSTVRRYLAQRAELLGAIRLPNDAFKKNAGAEVVSDIIFLQKRDRPLDIVPEWTQTGQTEDGFAINRYFIDHPEMVLGRQEPVSTAHGMDYTVNPIEGLEFSDQLHDAVKYIHGTYQEAEPVSYTHLSTIKLAHSMRSLDFTSQLNNIRCPVTILCGKKDTANLKASKRLKELLPKATLHIVPNAGHELNKYAPNTIAEILNN